MTAPSVVWNIRRSDILAIVAAVVAASTTPYDGIDWRDDELNARFGDRGLAVGPEDACLELHEKGSRYRLPFRVPRWSFRSR